jgi:hypothetical protein
LLIGLGPCAPVIHIDDDADEPVVGGLLPGTYLYLAEDGAAARCELGPGRSTIELGTATLRVRAAPGARFGVAPADSDELARLLAARLARPADADGLRQVESLPLGPHLVVGEAGRVLAEFEVVDPVTEVVIDETD